MYIQITTRCNMHCVHCGMACEAQGEDMPVDIFKAACELAEDRGDMISLGGGEPTLHPDFWTFIGMSLGYAEDSNVWLATNGSQTNIALKLARMAQVGIIGCALSLDDYHDPIDERVISAFYRGNKMNYSYPNENRDAREIRNVGEHIIRQGRAKDWGTSDDCLCNDLFITPDGRIWACSCKTVQFGTVFDPQIPDDYGYGLWDDFKCPEKYSRSLQDECAA